MPKKNSKQKIVLLDSHAILHRAYHALPDFSTSSGEPTGALYGISTMLFSILKELKPDYVIAAFDLPKPTYRHEAYADYKAGRKKADENLIQQIKKSRELFKVFNIPIYEKEGYEADDILGTLASRLKKDFNVIIASGDMDTLQLVDDERVQVYTLKKGIKDTILYDEKAVKERFGFAPELLPDYKGLRGDASDNIIGIPGIGEKTATDLIINFGSIEKIYKKLDEKNSEEIFKKARISDRIIKLLKDNQEEAEFSKMLATIQCDVEINFDLPEKTWKEGINKNKIKDLFRELEFRSLTGRLDEFLEEQGGINEIKEKEADEEKIIAPKINNQKLAEAKIMVWLINSSITNPEEEDIYAIAKTDDFNEAHARLEQEISKRGLNFVYEKIEKPLIPIIQKMEEVGVKIDPALFEKISQEYHGELEKIQTEIWEEAGEEFNINSPQQLADILFGKMGLSYKSMRKTSTGKYSTKEEVLQKLAEEHPIAEKILEYRELQKLLSTYIDNFPKMIGEDGRIHAEFLQTGTTTGRMSSNNPNLQNIPIGTERGRKIRKGFVAEKGAKLLALDYSQFELRIAAFLSGEEKLIKIFQEGKDIHTAVAAQIFEVSENEVTKDMRRNAKTINFGMLYGMGINALVANLKTDRKTAQEFYNKYFLVYEKLSAYLDNVKKEAAKNGFTTTLFGRRRYFEGFNSRLPFIRAQAERMAINAPIQGTQADMIKFAMVKIDEMLFQEKLLDQVRLIMQIHDEVIYEVKEEVVQKIALEIKNIMEKIFDKEQTKGVPIVAEYAIGQNWGEME